MWLILLTPLYLVLFLRYLTPKISRYNLDLWPSEVIWSRIFFLSFESSYVISYLTSPTVFEMFHFKHTGFGLDLRPLMKVIQGQEISYYPKAHIWFPIRRLCRPVAKGALGGRVPPLKVECLPLNMRNKKKNREKREKKKEQRRKGEKKKERRKKNCYKRKWIFRCPNPKSIELNDAIKSGRLDHPN